MVNLSRSDLLYIMMFRKDVIYAKDGVVSIIVVICLFYNRTIQIRVFYRRNEIFC